MSCVGALLFLCLCEGLLAAQEAGVPAYITIPVILSRTVPLDASSAGKPVETETTQDVPLPDNVKIRKDSKIMGRIISAQRGCLTLRLDEIRRKEGSPMPIRAGLRAVASRLEVRQAQLPTTSSDRGTNQWNWSTVQIGGDASYHGASVTEGSKTIGRWTYDGVIGALAANPARGCQVSDPQQDHALGLFSAGACGLYGLDDFDLKSKETDSDIVICGPPGGKLQSGIGMLLLTY
jgi:hypothetical protein